MGVGESLVIGLGCHRVPAYLGAPTGRSRARGIPVEASLRARRANAPIRMTATTRAREERMVRDPIWALVVGIDDELDRELTHEEGFTVDRAGRWTATRPPTSTPWSSRSRANPLEALAALRGPGARRRRGRHHRARATPPTARSRMHAGADDHLVRGSIPAGMLPRAVRYAVTVRRLRRELSTQDDETGLPNLRGFAPIAEHHLRMADRATRPSCSCSSGWKGSPGRRRERNGARRRHRWHGTRPRPAGGRPRFRRACSHQRSTRSASS